MSINQGALLNVMRERMTEDELRTLCFNLRKDIDYESLSGEGKDAKARALIIRLDHRNRLPDLAKAILEMRPDLKDDLGSESVRQPERADLLSDWMQDWFFLQLFFPLMILVAPYLIDKIVVQFKYPFQIAFSDGDPLLFSAMLLIGVSIHIKQMQPQGRPHRPGFWPIFITWAARVGAVIFLFSFGMLEYDVIHKGYFNLDAGALPRRVTIYSCFSCSSALISIGFSSFSFWKITRMLLGEAKGY